MRSCGFCCLCREMKLGFIEERYNNNFTSLCSTLNFDTISRPNSLIFRQNFFEKSSNGKSWVKKERMASTSILPSCSILSSKHLWAICLPRTLPILKPNQSFGFAFLLLARHSPSELGILLLLRASVDFRLPPPHSG